MNVPDEFIPLRLAIADDEPVGALRRAPACLLERAGFLSICNDRAVLHGGGDPTSPLDEARDLLEAAGLIGPRRFETMEIRAAPRKPPLGLIDRSAVRLFGFHATKVHINGIVEGDDALWLARRACHSRNAPLLFDTMVAGGQPHGQSIVETAEAEAYEEADLRPERMADLVRVGEIDTEYVSTEGFHPERLVVFDLLLPTEFEPRCNDGEIAEHVRVTRAEMLRLLQEGEIKHSSALVCRDLLSRRPHCRATVMERA